MSNTSTLHWSVDQVSPPTFVLFSQMENIVWSPTSRDLEFSIKSPPSVPPNPSACVQRGAWPWPPRPPDSPPDRGRAPLLGTVPCGRCGVPRNARSAWGEVATWLWPFPSCLAGLSRPFFFWGGGEDIKGWVIPDFYDYSYNSTTLFFGGI